MEVDYLSPTQHSRNQRCLPNRGQGPKHVEKVQAVFGDVVGASAEVAGLVEKAEAAGVEFDD